jgi:hypothetical protein
VKQPANRAIERLRDDDLMPDAVERSLALIENSLPVLDVEMWEALMEAKLCFVRLRGPCRRRVVFQEFIAV